MNYTQMRRVEISRQTKKKTFLYCFLYGFVNLGGVFSFTCGFTQTRLNKGIKFCAVVHYSLFIFFFSFS